jgi:hypothetical protein
MKNQLLFRRNNVLKSLQKINLKASISKLKRTLSLTPEMKEIMEHPNIVFTTPNVIFMIDRNLSCVAFYDP